jgi:hypothetical protein
MGALDDTITILIVGGVAYLVYDINVNGWCGGLLKTTPVCATLSIGEGFVNFFKNEVDIGVGVPFVLDECPAGWSNDGLICREPITCASGLDFFKQGCSGGALVGRLNKQTCPSDHPDNITGLCYKSCPTGYVHTPGMPYLCEPEGKNFWNVAIGDNWKAFIPFSSFF